jgi:hypothetical protein
LIWFNADGFLALRRFKRDGVRRGSPVPEKLLVFLRLLRGARKITPRNNHYRGTAIYGL